MTKVLVLYYRTYGHVEKMAEAAAEGARGIPGTEVTVKRVPELMPPEVARAAGVKLDQAAPVAKPAELADYDAILIGTPTRYGRMASQMANFLDQTGLAVGQQFPGRQGRKRVHLDGDAARRPGGHAILDHYQSFPFRDGGRGPALYRRRTDADRRDQWRIAIRRDDDCRWPRRA